MIRFIKEPDPDNGYDHTTVIMETTEISLQEILEDFASFLRGCGFVIDGRLEVYNAEEER